MKIFFFLLFVYVSNISFSQITADISIQCNNLFDDNISFINNIKNNSTITNSLNNFSNILPPDDYQNSQIHFQIVFFDEKIIGRFDLKEKHSATSKYIEEWKKLNKTKTILIFFTKSNKTQQKYEFNSVVVSQDIEDSQIPILVIEYINLYIFNHLENHDEIEVISKIINAINKSFDQSIKESIITRAQEVINMKRFYIFRNGFTWPFSYYYSITDIEDKLLYFWDENNSKWENVPDRNEHDASLFDYYNNEIRHDFDPLISIINGNYIYDQEKFTQLFIKSDNKYYNINSICENGNIEYSNENHQFQSETCFDNYITEPDIYDGSTLNPSITQNIENAKNSKIPNHPRLIKYIIPFEEYDYPKNYFTHIQIHKGTVSSTELYTYRQGSIYGAPKHRATWCNKFASELFREVLNDNNYSMPEVSTSYGMQEIFETSANDIYSSCIGNSINLPSYNNPWFIEMEGSGYNFSPAGAYYDDLWKDYINKGYYVVFAMKVPGGHGHIETGFPDNIQYEDNRLYWETVDFDDVYEDAPPEAIKIFEYHDNNGGNNYITVGAGANIGYKYVGMNSTNSFRKDCHHFIYLKYLFENN